MYRNNLARKAVPDENSLAQAHELVIPGCRNLVEFLEHGLHVPQPIQSGDGVEGDVLVIRGFDNLLHYLDWLDAQASQSSAYKSHESKNQGGGHF